jgi:hypothetical protein
MKRHVALLGKGLMTAGLGGVIAYLIALATTHSPVLPWLFGVFACLVIVGFVAYIVGQEHQALPPVEGALLATPDPAGIDSAEESWFVETEPDDAEVVTERPGPSGPAVTERWRYTSGGPEVAALQNHASAQPTHPGYMVRREEDKPPSLTFVIVLGCPPPDDRTISGTSLRSRFVEFLTSETVMSLVCSASFIADGLAWTERPGHGRILLEAALVRDPQDDREAPTAHAQLLLPEAGIPRYSRDGRRAELTLYLEPKDPDGKPLPPEELAAWHGKFVKALDLPKALVTFLESKLGLTATNDPATLFGALLRSRDPLTCMVSTAGLRMRPGARPSNWFYGYLVGDTGGATACAASGELLSELCEYTLQADDYEQTIASLCQARPGAYEM